MDDPIYTSVTSYTNGIYATVCLVTLVTYFAYTSMRKPRGLPPGPMSLPLIGNILNFWSKPTSVVFRDMSKKYGNLFSFKIGRWWVVVLNDIQLVKDSMLKKPAAFAGRPEMFTFEVISENYKSIMCSSYNDVWKLQRKLAHSSLRTFASSTKLENLVTEVTMRMSEKLDKCEGQPINPKGVISFGVYSLLIKLLFDEWYSEDSRLAFFIKDHIGQGFIADFIPIFRYIPTPGARKFKRVMKEYFAVLYAQLKYHRETFDKDNLRDICDLLIQSQKGLDEGSDHVTSLTDTHLVQTVSDLFGGGTDTTIMTLLWTVALLAEHPNVQKTCANEITKVIGHEKPSLMHRGTLPYLEATIMEVLRYSSLVPLGIPHTTTVETTLRGYTIPKGTIVLPNHYAIHYDDNYWDEPHKFMPEHFLDEAGSLIHHPESYIPHSIGYRSCPGESFANAELFLLVIWLIQNYEISGVPGREDQPVIDLDPFMALAREPKPYEVVITKRKREEKTLE